MDDAKCKDCSYFFQHYGFDKRKLFRVYCGHCAISGSKRKHPDTPACEHFLPGPSDTEAFVTKEYLSKELLQYVLGLELLPEIEDAPASSKKKTRRG